MQRNLSMVGQVDLFLCLDLLARSFIFLIETPFTLYWDSLRRSAVASVTPRGGVTEKSFRYVASGGKRTGVLLGLLLGCSYES